MNIEVAKLIVSIVGLGGTFIAVVIGVRSYLRTEQWKRAEFLAREMKEFFANERVQRALTLIDWGTRNVNLVDGDSAGDVLVTRRMQVRALLPHTLRKVASDPEVFSTNPKEVDHPDDRRFSPAEAAIRDCYDAFLDGLEAFSSYVKTGLIETDDLRSYLQYWIEDIHAAKKDADDAAWSAALATYIAVYRFDGVLWLFAEFDDDIKADTEAFKSFISKMADQELAQELNKAAVLALKESSLFLTHSHS